MVSMKKILYVVDSLKKRFGVTSVVTNYLSHIDFTEISVDLLAYDSSEEEIVSYLQSLGCQVYFMPELSLTSIREYMRFLDVFFEEHHYDIVHSHFNQVDYFVFSIAKKHGAKTFISHSHNTKFSENRLKAIRNMMMCLPARHKATYWAACGEKAGQAFYGKKFTHSGKRLIVNNAIECEKFRFNPEIRKQIRSDYKIPDETVLAGCVGSFKPQKNQIFLVDVIDELIRRHADKYMFLFAGSGDTLEAVRQAVHEKQLDSFVIFAGTVSNVDQLLQGLDVFLMPSLYEGLPVSAIEAQAAGLPCIISNNVTDEVALGETTYLDLDHPEEWVTAIEKYSLYNRKDDSDKIKEAGYDIDCEANRLREFYLHV